MERDPAVRIERRSLMSRLFLHSISGEQVGPHEQKTGCQAEGFC
jgi:hypothetical protein